MVTVCNCAGPPVLWRGITLNDIMKTFIISHYQHIKNIYVKYERWLMSAMLVGGFLFDFVLFVNIDIPFKLTVLTCYWFLAGVAIAFMQVYDAGKMPRFFRYVRLATPLVVQFCFGGLLNISLIFYWFSGAFSVSWPLLAITVALLLFNDRFRHQFSKPLVQIPVYFFVTFALFSLILPFWFASLNPWLFVVAGAGSVMIIGAYICGVAYLAGHSHWKIRQLLISIIVIAGIMNLLYFTNIIPPIPLALREAGLYHSLNVSGGQYVMKGEPETFWQQVQDAVFGQTVHVAPNEKIYLYTAIFAPTNLKTTMVHHWQYYDTAQKKWLDRGDLSFVISGGRQEGYKGYSWQTNLAPGQWRVYVENLRGQVLARVRFTVQPVDAPVELQEVIR